MTVDDYNPILQPGERLSRLLNGDYEVSDGTRQWRYSQDEWESLAGDAIEHMDSMQVLHHIRRGVVVGSLAQQDLVTLLDYMECRLAAEYEIAAASWRLWLESRDASAASSPDRSETERAD